MAEQNANQRKEKKDIVATRGRIFKGNVVKIFPKRAVIELERTVYVKKYERFKKSKTRLHARIPEGVELKKGDIAKIRECRPLSKIIHFTVIESENSRGVGKESGK